MEELSKAEAKTLWDKITASSTNTSNSAISSLDEFYNIAIRDYNKSQGNLDTYNCPKCRNRGIFYKLVGENVYQVECECLEIRKSIERLDRSGITEKMKENTFDTYIVTEKWQEVLKTRCMEFVDNFKLGDSIFLSGQSGSGKTHLCTAICSNLVRKYPLKYALWGDIVTKLQASIFKDDVYTQVSNELKTVDILYIDDLFKCISDKTAQSELKIAFKILNDRELGHKTTIFSSELTINEISTLDEAVAGRIVKMVTKKNLLQIAKNKDRNYRLKDLEMI